MPASPVLLPRALSHRRRTGHQLGMQVCPEPQWGLCGGRRPRASGDLAMSEVFVEKT